MSSESQQQGGVDGPADGSPYDVVGDDGNSYYPLNTTEGMVILIIMIVCMIMIPIIINRIMIYCDNKSNSYRNNKKEDDNKSSTTWKDYIRDGLYIEIKARKPIQDIVNELMAEQEPNIRDVGNIPIGPGCLVKEQEVRSIYKDTDIADSVVLILRLSLGLLASGHCTVDAETTVLRVAEALGIPSPRISIGHRLLTAQFGSSSTHILTCERDFVFSTLADLQSFSEMIICGEIIDVKVALGVCDILLDRRLPYGWIIYDLCFWLIAPWAAIAAYYGSYYDMLGAAVISPFTIVTYRLCHRFNITHLEVILVPLVVGIVTPLVWRYISNGGQDICHVLPQIFGCLLIWLPGAEVSVMLDIYTQPLSHSNSCLTRIRLSGVRSKSFKGLLFMELLDWLKDCYPLYL